jgi:membrane protein DedA with SNARE-associated domain/DNA-binding transcriptional ArsR family regulator
LSFIPGLHGAAALVLLCGLLFAEEAGVPLPTPGELTLVAAGLLIATGDLDPWLFVPAAIASCIAGSATGYGWARLVGQHGLRLLADRLQQTRRLAKVSDRLRQAGPGGIGIARLVPGLRIYTSLVAGAIGVDRRAFFAGIVPATVLWVGLFTVIGAVVGVPAEHFLTAVEQLVVQGGVLVALGAGGYLAIRYLPDTRRDPTVRLPPQLRMTLALAIDLALITSVVAGLLAMARPLVGAGEIAGWLDVVIVIAVIMGFYSLATWRGTRPTAGETLFGARYLTRAGQDPETRTGLGRLLRTLGRNPAAGSTADLGRAVDLLRMLSNQSRLRVARLLLEDERSVGELAARLDLPRPEVAHHVGELARAGVAEAVAMAAPAGAGGERGEPRYAIREPHIRAALAALLVHAASRPDQAGL